MSHRTEGKMLKLKSSAYPKRLLFFDTETFIEEYDNGEVRFPFRSMCSIYVEIDKNIRTIKREIEYFSSKLEFFEYLLSKMDNRNILNVFAHNIAFDLRVSDIFLQTIKLDKDNQPPIINNLVFIWSFKKDKAKIRFFDTANFGVRSVRQLGVDLGFPKMTIDFDNATDEEMNIYNLRDVEIIEKFMLDYLRFIHSNNLGGFKMTLASQALAAFRTSFYKENIVLHSHNGATQLERDSYYGGRTEIFKHGQVKGNEFYMLDVNSMYPYVMANKKMPVRLVGYSDNSPVSRLTDLSQKYYIIADVSIDCDYNFIPFRIRKDNPNISTLHNHYGLKYPDKNNYNLIFPIGRFRTVIHDAEIRELIACGHIIKIHRLAWYEQELVFSDYVDFFYSKKSEYKTKGNKSYYLMSKLFNNTLYGKFGQLEPHREYVGFNTEERFQRYPEYNQETHVHSNRLIWNWREYYEYKQGETSFSYPAIAGAITASARIYLYSLFNQAGYRNVFYCDTDSLILNKHGYNNLSKLFSKQELGKLDLDKQGVYLYIWGNKDYELDNKTVHKGLPSTSEWIDDNTWRYVQFEGFITSWRKNSLGEMRGEYRLKSRLSEYNKGILNEDGTVSPYELKEF